jgi:hypothetical protein
MQPEWQCGDEKKKCDGACLHGKNAKLDKCTITKKEILPGSDTLCSGIRDARICSELKKWIENANKRFPNQEWQIRKCTGEEKCDCGKYTLTAGKQKIELKDEIIDSTGKVEIPVYGELELHCIMKISGTFEVSGGGFAISRCALKDK